MHILVADSSMVTLTGNLYLWCRRVNRDGRYDSTKSRRRGCHHFFYHMREEDNKNGSLYVAKS